MDGSFQQLKDKSEADKKEARNKIEEIVKRSRTAIANSKEKHEKALGELKAAHQEETNAKLEEMKQQQRTYVDEMRRRHEEKVEKAARDADAIYETKVDELNQNHQKIIQEKIDQLQKLAAKASEMKQLIQDLKGEVQEKNERIGSLEEHSRMAEVARSGEVGEQSKLLEERDVEIANFKQMHAELQSNFEGKVQEAEARVADLEMQLKATTALHLEEIKDKNNELQKLVLEAEESKKRSEAFNRGMEEKIKEYDNRVVEFQHKLHFQQENHERETAWRLEALELQQQSSADEVSSQLTAKLSEANDLIGAQEKTIQSFQLREEDLQNSLEALQVKLDGDLEAANENLQLERQKHAEQLSIINTALQEVNTHNERYSEEVKALRKALEDTSVLSSNLKDQIASLQEDKEKLEIVQAESTSILEVELASKQTKVSDLETELSKVQELLETKEREQGETLAKLDAEIKTKEEELESLSKKLEELQKSNEEAVSNFERICKEKDSLSASLEDKCKNLEEQLVDNENNHKESVAQLESSFESSK